MGEQNTSIFSRIALGLKDAHAVITGESLPIYVTNHNELKLVQAAIRLTVLERGNQLENIYKVLNGLLPLERIASLVSQSSSIDLEEPPKTLYAPVHGVGIARYDGVGDGKHPVVLGEKAPTEGYYVPVDAHALYNALPMYKLMGTCWVAMKIPPEYIKQQGPIEGL